MDAFLRINGLTVLVAVLLIAAAVWLARRT